MNSYWILSVGWMMATDKDSSFNHNPDVGIELSPTTPLVPSKMAQATIHAGDEKVVCSFPWLVAFTVSTVIALASAFSDLVITSMATGPRLAMNLSTVIRDNPHVDASSIGSYLDDSERSRILKDTMVRMGDVAHSKEIGHIAIASASIDHGVVVARLWKGRYYD